MSERTGAVSYRHLAARAVLLGTGNSASLQNINTTPLNDGALCYVVAESSYYVLDRSLALATVSPVIVTPASGPGTWLRVFGQPGVVPVYAMVALLDTPQALVIATQDVWVNPPANGAGDYVLLEGVAGLFALDTTTGILTYSGPARRFLINAHASVASATNAAQSVEMIPNLGALVGTSTSDTLSGRSTTGATIDTETEISASIVLNLTTGAQLRTIFRNLTGTDDLSIERLSMVVTALAP